MSPTAPLPPTDPPPAAPSAAAPTPTAPSATGASAASFWAWLRGLGLTRSSARWIGGVAGGIAARYHVDPLLVRGLFVVGAMLGGVGFIAYALVWALLPEPDGRIHAEELTRGRFDQADIGIALFLLIGLDPVDAGGAGSWVWGAGKGVGWVLLIGLGLWVWSQHRASVTPSTTTTTGAEAPEAGAGDPSPWGSPTGSFGASAASGVYDAGHEPTAPAKPAGSAKPAKPAKPNTAPSNAYVAAVIGATGLVIAALLIADRMGAIEASTLLIVACALGVLGLGIVISGLAGRRGGLLSFLAVIVLVLVPGAANRQLGWNVDLTGVTIAGNADWTPTSASEAAEGLRLIGGSAQVDLTAVPLPAPGSPPVTVPVQITAGNAVVTLPEGEPLLLDVEVFAGSATWDVSGVRGEDDDGVRTQKTVHVGPDEDPRLVLELTVGAGEATIKGAP